MATAELSVLGALTFPGTWRGYQQLALEAFESDRERGELSTYIVAPPGSGKTLLGMELIRRLGSRALVLAPNTAVAALRAGGIKTIVLDECHHLASMWGYVVRAALTQLPGVHVIALTATPPDALTTEEFDLYTGLLGPVDYSVPTPALVRERALAPYQELAWLTRPLDAETAWLAEHDLRFTELITGLHTATGGVTSLPEWVIRRLRERGRGPSDDAQVSWAAFQRAHPSLARAGARFLSSGGLELPADVPRGEGYREKPDLDDWLVLLEDYSLRCLAADAGDAARGVALRALVLTDTEQASAPGAGLAELLPADAGSAPAALIAVAADPRTRALRPLLVTGRGLRCTPDDADELIAALRHEAAMRRPHGADALTGWRAEPGESAATRAAEASAEQPGYSTSRRKVWV